MGTMYFGVLDRNTNILEVRPTTLCNINCTFCSVNAGPKATYKTDFVVEESYLAEEIKKIVEFKDSKMDIWINPQGDPTVYPDLIPLIKDCRKIKHVNKIIIITNGLLLSEKKIDDYKEAGLTQISLSMNAFTNEKAAELAGLKAYNIEKIRRVCTYAAKQLELVLTPVYMKNTNEQEIESIVNFAKEIGAEISIQNFCKNRRGRNPVSSVPFKKFYKHLQELETKFNMKLIKVDKLIKTPSLPKVAKRGQVIEANIIMDSKYENEKIAIYKDKCIIVYNAKRFGIAKVKIMKASHNFYYAKAL